MILRKITSRASRVGLSLALLVSTIVPAVALLAPASVSAAACAPSGGGAGGGLPPLITLRGGSAANVASTVVKIGTELTPQANWGTFDNFSTGAIELDNASCALLGQISFGIDGTKKMTVGYYDTTRSGAFVATTDYTGLASGVAFTGLNNASASFTYTLPTFVGGTPQLISYDLSNAGWVDVKLKTGSGVESLLFSVKAPTGLASFAGAQNFTYVPTDQAFTQCSQITGSVSLHIRSLLDGTAEALVASPDTFNTCATFDKTSYDTVTKTANLNYDIAGAAVSHTVTVPGQPGGAPDPSPGGGFTSLIKSLVLSTDGKNFNDYFVSSTSASQQLYLGTTATAGSSVPLNVPIPIVGFVADLSAANLDLVAKGVTYDVADTATQHAALAHNVGTVSKDGTFSLFVPFTAGDTFVGVCAGATALSGVNSKCTGVYYLKDGQTKTSKDTKSILTGHSSKATVVTIGAKKFWQIDGLTGTGAFGSTLAADPATGVSIHTTSAGTAAFAIIATLGLAYGARRMNATKK